MEFALIEDDTVVKAAPSKFCFRGFLLNGDELRFYNDRTYTHHSFLKQGKLVDTGKWGEQDGKLLVTEVSTSGEEYELDTAVDSLQEAYSAWRDKLFKAIGRTIVE